MCQAGSTGDVPAHKVLSEQTSYGFGGHEKGPLLPGGPFI